MRSRLLSVVVTGLWAITACTAEEAGDTKVEDDVSTTTSAGSTSTTTLHMTTTTAEGAQAATLGRLANGDLVRLAELADVTSEGETLAVDFAAPVSVVGLRVETVESPSWVSWFEIEVVAAP